ncbi:hypothetical protein E3N88_08873 [Mikania micrantha]|uniref:TF-B3 domain-containing protein n=1 Tax=Mikania micrantha TaxID=192012 RepID=A0A5N6PIF4_9ASTR|nr:hypothetical protein E3N88_08873 [Mikania micrantha]
MANLHPAVIVTNIKNFIHITLVMENALYTSWSELFKIHCTAFQVLDHILPSPPPVAPSAAAGEAPPAPPPADPIWAKLDAIVLQWIYGTISTDLLHTILKPKATAAQAWEALESIFLDNKSSRALYLQSRFSNLTLQSFLTASAYCQELKVLADQLANVDAPVSASQLVLQLINGLTGTRLDAVGMMLQQTKPLPDFYEARSSLILEETRQSQQPAPDSPLHSAKQRKEEWEVLTATTLSSAAIFYFFLSRSCFYLSSSCFNLLLIDRFSPIDFLTACVLSRGPITWDGCLNCFPSFPSLPFSFIENHCHGEQPPVTVLLKCHHGSLRKVNIRKMNNVYSFDSGWKSLVKHMCAKKMDVEYLNPSFENEPSKINIPNKWVTLQVRDGHQWRVKVVKHKNFYKFVDGWIDVIRDIPLELRYFLAFFMLCSYTFQLIPFLHNGCELI